MGSSHAVGKNFSFCNSCSFSLGSHPESANTNEINRDIHLAYILFYQENSMFLKVLFSFKVACNSGHKCWYSLVNYCKEMSCTFS